MSDDLSMSAGSQTVEKPPRFQFRLRTLTLGVVGVALVAATVAAIGRARYLEARMLELRREHQQARSEAGYFDVTDPSQVSIVRKIDPQPASWTWRVWLPKGTRWNWRVAIKDKNIGQHRSRPSKHDQEFPLDGGAEYLVVASVRKTPGGKWWLDFSADTPALGVRIGGRIELSANSKLVEWAERGNGNSSTSVTSGRLCNFGPTEYIELFRLWEVDRKTGKPIPRDGLHIWLEPVKPVP